MLRRVVSMSGQVATRQSRNMNYKVRNDGIITKAELEEVIQTKRAGTDYRLIDVREPFEVELGLIPTALSVPLKEFPNYVEMHGPELDDLDVIVYCKSGARSHQAVQYLRKLGHSRAWNYRGSFLEWFPDRPY